MPVIRFTELSLENLKPEKQTRYFDSALANSASSAESAGRHFS
jgi:hypothetical protein